MPVENYSIGQLNPIVYFVAVRDIVDSSGKIINYKGDISVPPTTEDALRFKDEVASRGWELKEAGTLPEVDELQKKWQKQEYDKLQRELESEDKSFAIARKRIRDRLVSRMISSSTRPYERDFIRSYLQLADEKRESYRKRFLADICYINIRENDSRHHLHSLIDKLPEMKDDACVRCKRYRKVKNYDLCIGCLGVELESKG